MVEVGFRNSSKPRFYHSRIDLDLETIVNLDFIIIELVLTWENI